ncbi:MAG: YhfC family intramembrane metalloprotease [Ruminococcus sp.]|nr:YhfC family intramembrane metalloprotease [Ruminococcus sp.]
MTDLSCLLSGLIRLLTAPVLLIILHKKTGARLYPAVIALLACLPAFIIAGVIRSGFSHDNFYAYYIRQGLLYGIFEEGAKFLVLRFYLTSYDSRRDAVSYGIGHSAFEDIGAGLSCFGLIGTDRAAPDILLHNIWAEAEGVLLVAALTVLIFYGIQTGKSKVMLPAAILLHAFGNMIAGLFIDSAAIIARTLLTAGICFAAYRCYRALWTPFEDEA